MTIFKCGYTLVTLPRTVTPSPICKCPEKAVQTARHLLTECSLFSSERPAVLQTLSPHLVLKHHINTISITSFFRSIFHALQEQDSCIQTQEQLRNNILPES